MHLIRWESIIGIVRKCEKCERLEKCEGLEKWFGMTLLRIKLRMAGRAERELCFVDILNCSPAL